MAKKLGHRQKKTFVCSVCGNENYREEKNVNNTPGRMEISKYCKFCGRHTTHKEKNNNITVI